VEIWDIYDENRNLTGRTMIRGSEVKEGEFHLVIHVCIFNFKDQMLVQKRQPWKESWPDMWDITVGGSAIAGETSAQAAERETLEEIGCKIDLSNETPCFSVKYSVGFDDYYVVEREIDSCNLTLQYEEVQAVKWADEEEILQLIKEERLIPYHDIERLFSIHKQKCKQKGQ